MIKTTDIQKFAKGIFNLTFEEFGTIFDEKNIYNAPQHKQEYVQEKFNLMQNNLLRFLGIIDIEKLEKLVKKINKKL